MLFSIILALLIRELPITADEAEVNKAITRFGGAEPPIRVCMSASRQFAFAQMPSVAEATVAYSAMQRACPYIDNCAGLC